jgi:hypothetical protein
MSKQGFTSVSLNDETTEMLWKIAAQVKAESGVELEKLPQIIKHLAKTNLKVVAK